MLLHVGLAPALDAFDEDHPTERTSRCPPIASVIVASACATRRRSPRLALEQLDAAGATALRLGERAQPRPALGDRPVVVAVNQVGGLQRCHLA